MMTTPYYLFLRGIYVLLCVLAGYSLRAQPSPLRNSSTDASRTALPLREGDRVLFVGNAIFENDLLTGYLELALATRWPERNCTFRNIGWTGDTVFGEARSYFTNPPSPRDLLYKQLTDARPTVVFLAYGNVESEEGEEGLEHFAQGLNALMDTIQKLGARLVLLSPTPTFRTAQHPHPQVQNEQRLSYSQRMARLASSRNVEYIDIYHPLAESKDPAAITDNGVHLNAAGYYQLAGILESKLGLPDRSRTQTIEASLPKGRKEPDPIAFTVSDYLLPLPYPAGFSAQEGLRLVIKGLKKGLYTLQISDEVIHTAPAKEWSEGVLITQGPQFRQVAALQQLVVKKNELFFQQYRPQNRTYIQGFRSYEQGRHAQGLADLSLIITWLEAQIAHARTASVLHYQLIKHE